MDSPRSEVLSPTSIRPKSPPAAFEPSSNDSLAPLSSPARTRLSLDPFALTPSIMGLTASPAHSGSGMDLQVIVDQQASAIALLHEAFAAERQVWSLEKDRFLQRISSLEQLLKNGDHHSPAKSPILSPSNGNANASSNFGSLTSPQSQRSSNAQRLPSIAEDENTLPLAARREGAPRSIDFLGGSERASRSHRGSNVSFDGNDVMVDEVPISPPTTARNLSPLPPNNRALAGHTPLRAPRAPTPPISNMLDGSEDTPTRHNTNINLYLVRSQEGEEDVPLKGPLSLPELPNKPEDSHFTLEALSRRLEQVARSPEEARPMVFAQKSPGLASPAEPADSDPTSTGFVQSSSGVISPSTLTAPQTEYNGVKLKKKASVNFGAPLGQLGGFGGRRMS
ncbi:hypothetical protein LTR10_000517 [Elasticomyces elasticus]|nr:hypothetical protein LTR10_000517 [Elasticomyces elasticus]KAK4980235.1 hypothetical protein LTR42_000542 [Elasticomyces elasticus]